MSSHVAATGFAQTRVAPDRATLTLVIRVLSPESLQKAAQQMAPLERALLDGMASAGIGRSRVVTLRYATGRERLYQREPLAQGYYYVDHVLSVEVERIDTLGAVVAAARRAGVTRIDGVTFWLSDDETYREAVTRQAVAQAIARARTLAEAAGGRLGTLVRLGTREALTAALGTASGGAGDQSGAAFAVTPDMPGDVDDRDEEPVILTVPITVGVEVHGAWEVFPADDGPRPPDSATPDSEHAA